MLIMEFSHTIAESDNSVDLAISQAAHISGVTRICCEEGQSWKLGHGALTADFRAGCSSNLMTNDVVTNAVLMQTKEL